MEQQYGDDFISVTDEDGKEYELEVLAELEHDGSRYLALVPAGSGDDEAEDLEVSILKSVEENGEEFLEAIEDDAELEAVYSALMVAATPVCNAIFSGILNASGYDQSADVALNTLGQSAAVNTAISVSYIWVETAAYALCAVLVFLWTVEKNLPAEQAAIVERKKGATQ